MMNKNRILGLSFFIISMALYNTIVFAAPIERTASFWVVYLFTTIAFLTQLVVSILAFSKTYTMKSKFLGLPTIYVGSVYLLLQYIVSAIFIIFSKLPAWVAVVSSAILLGISAICFISIEFGKDEIKRVEEKVAEKVIFIKSMLTHVDILQSKTDDTKLKNELHILADKIKYSDPMSNNELAEIEAKITEKVSELKTSGDKMSIIKELDLMIAERNQKCKILK